MASYLTNKGKERMANGQIQIGTSTLKLMLLKTITGADPDLDEIADFTGAGCEEADCTNYTGGFGGGGRKSVTLAAAEDDTNNAMKITISGDQTWTNLGGAANNNIKAALLVKEDTSDALSPVLAFIDFTDTDTNGGNFTLSWASNLIATLTNA